MSDADEELPGELRLDSREHGADKVFFVAGFASALLGVAATHVAGVPLQPAQTALVGSITGAGSLAYAIIYLDGDSP